ncbi:MAG TPA: hypothetical protein VLF42_11465 [Burkholderiales bacterium]|nr:hypothetical protein [Burkholderiales bacterium]
MNPYAAPTAKVDAAASAPEPVFFAVSGLKLALMSVVTLGLYEVYWFYKNWKCVQRNSGDRVNAPLRAIFYPVISYPLFKRIRSHAQGSGVQADFPAGALAGAVFVLTLLWRLPDPWWLAGFLGVVALLPVQAAANAINRKQAPAADPNTRFTGWNILGLVAGGLVVILAIIGAFAPVPE